MTASELILEELHTRADGRAAVSTVMVALTERLGSADVASIEIRSALTLGKVERCTVPPGLPGLRIPDERP
jgi:hypothetical protein